VFLNLFQLAAHLTLEKIWRHTDTKNIFLKDQVKPLYCIPNAFFSPKRIVKVKTYKLAAHLEVAHGTLVCRGTPVEKHCSRLINTALD